MWSSFAYHEPSTSSTLILLAFLYLLNLAGWLLQATIGAGLLGQILIGVIFGTPLAGWLPASGEEAFVALGYGGLLLLVFEGGMQSSIAHLARILPLASAVALTGIVAPIGLSFILLPMGFPALHAFAAGSSLASTSLGTVLTVLHPASVGFDLRQTKLGAVLFTAAVMDDVVAFILARVIAVIGGEGNLGAEIGRTLGVTIGMGIVWGALTRWALKPLHAALMRRRAWDHTPWGGEGLLLLVNALIFVGLVAAAGYGGTSMLYGAYIAGLSVAYLCSEVADTTTTHELPPVGANEFPLDSDSCSPASSTKPVPTLMTTFDNYVSKPLTYLLLPIFFGSIGYSIPFVPLFRGRVIWRGIVYAVLMTIGKLLCGLWLVMGKAKQRWRAAVFLGGAMVARGEIGLLISQIARGTADPLLNEDEFLVVVWAVVLCTIVGPVGVAMGIRRWGKSVLDGGME